MKKNYLKPETLTTKVEMQQMICTSPGVATGSGTGDEYNDGDVTYSRESDWDD